MNTRKRLAAMRRAELRQVAELDNPACVIGPGESCEHALVDQELNRRLYAYEETVRGRFTPIVDTLKTISAFQHDAGFGGEIGQRQFFEGIPLGFQASYTY